jgi:hypothetical protein
MILYILQAFGLYRNLPDLYETVIFWGFQLILTGT